MKTNICTECISTYLSEKGCDVNYNETMTVIERDNLTNTGITPLMLAVASQSGEYGGWMESVQSLLSQPDIGKKDILILFHIYQNLHIRYFS